MRRVCGGILCAVLLAAAQAEEAASRSAMAPPSAAELVPQHSGYAFEQPEILLRQRLFGLAHGLSLLAASCLDLAQHSEPVQDAYAAWHARQATAIDTLVHDLGRHYFGAGADRAQWRDLVRALNLKDRIDSVVGEVGLQEACATLPAAIVGPRYDFERLLAGSVAPVAVSPAPTLQRRTP